MEGPHLLAGGDDLLGRQQEAVVARVAELHAVAAGIVMTVNTVMPSSSPCSHSPVGDPELAQGPVDGAAAGRVEHAGDAAHLQSGSGVELETNLC